MIEAMGSPHMRLDGKRTISFAQQGKKEKDPISSQLLLASIRCAKLSV